MLTPLLLLLQLVSPDSSTWPVMPIPGGGEVRYLAPLMGDADYPIEAKRAGAEGAATIEVTVAPSGEIIGCEIIGSSGRLDFDERSCALYRDRAKFEISGRSTPAKFRLRVNWLLNR